MADAFARFVELVGQTEDDVALDEGALLIAAHAYPDLDIAAQRARIDDIAAGCPEPTLDGLRHHLFGVLGFTGNSRHYADPRNSFLNDVLERRLGIPITLSVVAIEVGRRVGVALEGVGMPGHFLVRHADGRDVFVDPFNGGRLLDAAGCEKLFRSMHGDTTPFDPDLLAPLRRKAILARMLSNLRRIYGLAGDARSLGWVLRLRAAIPAETVYELAELASIQESLGRFRDGAATLEALAGLLPREGAERARAHAALFRSRLN